MKQNKFFYIFFLFFIITSCSIYSEKNFSLSHTLIIPRSINKISKHPDLKLERKTRDALIWHKKSTLPFSELIPSWNASRPKVGKFVFYLNIKHKTWSGWKKIAEWGKGQQKSFYSAKDKIVHVKHVRAELQNKILGHEFKIKAESFGGADIRRVFALFANTANWHDFKKQIPDKNLPSIVIPKIKKLSQFWIDHKRKEDLCTPTSMAIIAQYLANQKKITLKKQNIKKETVDIANNVYDSSLNIYGNWQFNIAQAFNTTRGKILYKVERANNFAQIHKYLQQKIPVPVSIRGALTGGAWPYVRGGHYVVVIGWDQKHRKVICLDPAFSDEKKILRYYDIDEFIHAWSKSRNMAYKATYII